MTKLACNEIGCSMRLPASIRLGKKITKEESSSGASVKWLLCSEASTGESRGTATCSNSHSILIAVTVY